MKNKIIICLLIISLIFIIYLFSDKSKNDKVKDEKQYSYICFNKKVGTDTIINESIIKKCFTKEKLSNDVIVDISQVIDENKLYKYIGEYKGENEFIYKDEIMNISLEESFEVELTDFILFPIHGSSEVELREMKIYIQNKKLYATDLRTGETKCIFDIEDVYKIGERSLSGGAGGFKLIILTTNKNVYLSDNELGYKSIFDTGFSTKKLNVQNVSSFKMVVNNQGKQLWAIDVNGNEIMIEK